MNQEMYMKRILLKTPLVNYLISFQTRFFLEFELPNSGCDLSGSAAYLQVFTVNKSLHGFFLCIFRCNDQSRIISTDVCGTTQYNNDNSND